MMTTLIYIYNASVLIAFVSSLISFRLDFPFHLKVFSVLLGLTCLVEITSTLLLWHHLRNYWLYNCFMLLEFWVYAYYYRAIIPRGRMQKIIQGFMLIFPIFWAAIIYKFHLNVWNAYLVTTGSFFSILFALMYYYRIVTAARLQAIGTLPEFWIATGMLIFYLGSFAFFGMLNFINKHEEIAKRLLEVYLVLDILMYLLFSYGFLCRTINTKRFSSS